MPATAPPPPADLARPCDRSARALARWKQSRRRPWMVSDWDQTVMLHYAVDPEALQPQIPFDLDTRDGVAYVSLVAFTLRRLRLHALPEALRVLVRPVSEHGFLNVRTYVRTGAHRDGIFFLAEWLPNQLSITLGPPMYGLPYRYGTTEYRHDHDRGCWYGRVEPRDEDASLRYTGTLPNDADYRPAEHASLDAFLLERYTAFTERRGTKRSFEVWHRPWPQCRAPLKIDDASLLETTGPWHRDARYCLAHVSPGVRDVWIGGPQRMKAAG
ncbi:MAG: DUF2071 domain-containing protein [Planctomycetota bacterium]